MHLKTRSVTLLIFFICLITIAGQAQLSVRINTGLMNYGGDLQRAPFTFNQARLTAGADVMYGLHNIILRAGFSYGAVQADDATTKIYANRNLSFKTNITEFNFCAEYDFNPGGNRNLIPYVFAGIGAYHYNPYTSYNGQKVYLRLLGTEGEGLSIYPGKKLYSLTNSEYPLGIGIKYKISSGFLVGIEFNSRLIFTDYLDDVSGNYPDEAELFKERGQLAVNLSYRGNELNGGSAFPSGKPRGNPHQNDNFYSSVITFAYIFPDHSLSGNGKHSKLLDCPKKIR